MPARVRLRWGLYAGASAVLAAGVVLKALAQRPNFFSAAVYLSQSSANLMILTNMVLVTASSLFVGLQKLLYGSLRPIEIEQLYEKAWFAVTETLLAMTIFRGDMGHWFLTMFFALLAGKVWGWIAEGRVEILEQQPPRNPRLFHTRLAISLGVGIFYNFSMLEYCTTEVMLMAKPDMMVMFGFEFAILSIMSFATAGKYSLHLLEIGIVRKQKALRAIEMQKERITAAKRDLDAAELAQSDPPPTAAPTSDDQTPPAQPPTVEQAREALRQALEPVDDAEIEVEGWEAKGRYVFYFDLAIDFFKLVTYMSFFFILLIFYGLPIHIMRDVFLTTRSFFKRISDFIKYRAATRDMNDRYPDATAEEIGTEGVCIICREDMVSYQPAAPGDQQRPNPVAERMRPKKLPCGHILHFSCLRSWLERQQVCPTCRRPVLSATGAANPAQPGAPGAGQAQRPPGARPGPRVYQFGPLRIGVGAHRGNNMLQELQQGLVNGRAPAQPAAPQQDNGVQQFGIGFGWDARRSRRRHHRRTVREQLDSLEQQIQQEISSLTMGAEELATLRNMQQELERLRGSADPHVPIPLQPAPTNARMGAIYPPYRPSPWEPYQADRSQIIQAGSDNLPAGMTLPEGWSMMPMRQVGQGANIAPQMPFNGAIDPRYGMPLRQQQVPPQGVPVAPNPASADYIRAMFTGMPNQNANNLNPTAIQPQPGPQSDNTGTAATSTHPQHTAVHENDNSSTTATQGDSQTETSTDTNGDVQNLLRPSIPSASTPDPSYLQRMQQHQHQLHHQQAHLQAHLQTLQAQHTAEHRANLERLTADMVASRGLNTQPAESLAPPSNTAPASNSTSSSRGVAEDQARMHEAWLASMRVPSQSQTQEPAVNGGMQSQSSAQVNTQPTSNAQLPEQASTTGIGGNTTSVSAEPSTQQAPSPPPPPSVVPPQAQSHPQDLPNWGSSIPSPTPSDSHSQRGSPAPNTNGHGTTAPVNTPANSHSNGDSHPQAGSASELQSQSQTKQPSVEDLVENVD